MSHSDMSILAQMRESADYKLGSAMSSIRSAINHLENGRKEEAIKELYRTVNSIRTTAEVSK